MSTTHTILIEPAALGARGRRYRVSHAGRVLLGSAREPLLEACRALAAHGITGRLEMRRPGRPHWDMAADIEQGALLTVAETDAVGPAFHTWEPFRYEASEHAFPVVTGRARTAARKSQVGRVQPENRLPAG